MGRKPWCQTGPILVFYTPTVYQQTNLTELKYYKRLFSPDIGALTEVLLKKIIFQATPQVYQLDGYSLFTSNLSHGRGIILYTKETLCATDFIVTNDYQEHVWGRLSLTRVDKLLIGCIYRSPHCTAVNVSKFYGMLRNICSQKTSHLLIFGDFNLKEINWDF